jgi:hypothetical protein
LIASARYPNKRRKSNRDRFSEARSRDTYQNFMLVASEPLGMVRHWTPAFAIGIHLEVPLK